MMYQQPSKAVITASASGATQVVAGVANKTIKVLGYVLSFAGTVNAKFQSASTDKTGLLYGVASTLVAAPIADPEDGAYWFETAAGEDLNINLSGNVAVGGHIAYIQS